MRYEPRAYFGFFVCGSFYTKPDFKNSSQGSHNPKPGFILSDFKNHSPLDNFYQINCFGYKIFKDLLIHKNHSSSMKEKK